MLWDSSGDHYQWGRAADGHEKIDSTILNEQSTVVQPNHSSFIIGLPLLNNASNPSTWEGIDAINNPCPCGFRLPNPIELTEEINSWQTQNAAGAFQSTSKFSLTGYRGHTDGVFGSGGLFGYY